MKSELQRFIKPMPTACYVIIFISSLTLRRGLVVGKVEAFGAKSIVDTVFWGLGSCGSSCALNFPQTSNWVSFSKLMGF